MALSTYVAPTASIEVPGNDALVVRGLGLGHIVTLVRTHEASLSALFDLAASGADAGALLGALEDLPFLAAQAIALGAREPDAWEVAMELPPAVQAEAIEAIVRLTVNEHGWGKLVEIVGRIRAAMPPSDPAA